jgi:sigma-B regulation protein RsbU (phosphoserine phosphatase)
VTAHAEVFPGTTATVSDARLFVRQALGELHATGAGDDAAMLVSELATNAVIHAHTSYTVDVVRDGATIRVRVHDGSAAIPQRRRYDPGATTGRGLRLVASIASTWGVELEESGKSIWFTLPAEGPPIDQTAG